MQEGIRDAVITLSGAVEVGGVFGACLIVRQGRGRRLQTIRRWRVNYIIVVHVEEAHRVEALKTPTHPTCTCTPCGSWASLGCFPQKCFEWHCQDVLLVKLDGVH